MRTNLYAYWWAHNIIHADNCPCMYHKLCYYETRKQWFGQLNIVYHISGSGEFSGTDVRCYHIFPIPVFLVLLRSCPDEPLSAGQFEDNCPPPNLFRDMKKAFNFKEYSFLFECMFDWNVVRNERFWPFLAPPKRKVVGSNPARNANLEGGGRKNRFPLLLSQKTISV